MKETATVEGKKKCSICILDSKTKTHILILSGNFEYTVVKLLVQ